MNFINSLTRRPLRWWRIPTCTSCPPSSLTAFPPQWKKWLRSELIMHKLMHLFIVGTRYLCIVMWFLKNHIKCGNALNKRSVWGEFSDKDRLNLRWDISWRLFRARWNIFLIAGCLRFVICLPHVVGFCAGAAARLHPADAQVQHGARQAGLGQGHHQATLVAQACPLG